jgi:hypothetical protein
MEGDWLCINLPLHEIKQTLARLNSTKQYEVEIKQSRKRRSLNANAYFWTLVGKLSAKVGIPPDEIYRNLIPEVGDNYQIIPIEEDSVEEFCRLWCEDHIGRIAEDFGACRNTPGYRYVRVYKGSSDYDTAQMSRLIQLAVDECREFGIETLTPNEIARMVDLWQSERH